MRAAAEIVHLTADEVERSAGIGVKVRHIFLIFDVDGDQYSLSVTAPLPDCLLVGEQQLLKVAAVQRFVFPMWPRSPIRFHSRCTERPAYQTAFRTVESGGFCCLRWMQRG